MDAWYIRYPPAGTKGESNAVNWWTGPNIVCLVGPGMNIPEPNSLSHTYIHTYMESSDLRGLVSSCFGLFF